MAKVREVHSLEDLIQQVFGSDQPRKKRRKSKPMSADDIRDLLGGYEEIQELIGQASEMLSGLESLDEVCEQLGISPQAMAILVMVNQTYFTGPELRKKVEHDGEGTARAEIRGKDLVEWIETMTFGTFTAGVLWGREHPAYIPGVDPGDPDPDPEDEDEEED